MLFLSQYVYTQRRLGPNSLNTLRSFIHDVFQPRVKETQIELSLFLFPPEKIPLPPANKQQLTGTNTN